MVFHVWHNVTTWKPWLLFTRRRSTEWSGEEVHILPSSHQASVTIIIHKSLPHHTDLLPSHTVFHI
jgi:hypothetical protein